MDLTLRNTDIGVLKVLTGFDTEALYFGMVHPIKRDRTIRIISGAANTLSNHISSSSPVFTTCREVFTGSTRTSIAGMCFETVKTNKMRMLIWHKHRPAFYDNTCGEKNVLKAFNIIEKEKGWKLSRLYKIKNVKTGPLLDTDCHLFIGPRQWISSPYMASLYALLARIILKRSLVIPRKSKTWAFNDLKDLTSKIKSIECPDVSALYNPSNKDSNWRVIIDNYEELHKGGIRSRWLNGANKNSGNYHSNVHKLFADGPDRLIRGCSYSCKMQEKYNELLV